MFFKLIVDGVLQDTLIKATNSVIASDIASEMLCGDFKNDYSIEHIEESEIDSEMANTFTIVERVMEA